MTVSELLQALHDITFENPESVHQTVSVADFPSGELHPLRYVYILVQSGKPLVVLEGGLK